MKASNTRTKIQIEDLNLKGDYQADFLAKGIKHTDENKELGLKKGDVIEFWGGYDNDIRFRSRIHGFDSDGKAYVNWDCYWFPVDLTEKGNRDFKLVQE